MTSTKSSRKRSKTLTFMLLPALIFIGIMGLFMYLAGNPSSNVIKKSSHNARQENSITFVPAVYEEHAKIICK